MGVLKTVKQYLHVRHDAMQVEEVVGVCLLVLLMSLVLIHVYVSTDVWQVVHERLEIWVVGVGNPIHVHKLLLVLLLIHVLMLVGVGTVVGLPLSLPLLVLTQRIVTLLLLHILKVHSLLGPMSRSLTGTTLSLLRINDV